jgi:hypothetical protein
VQKDPVGRRRIFCCSPPSSHQRKPGQITGRVVDASGGVLPGASITVTNPQTGVAATEPANSAGVYVFPNLLPGTYNVKVELQGFQSAVRNGVELQTQQTVRLDFPSPLARSPRRWRLSAARR